VYLSPRASVPLVAVRTVQRLIDEKFGASPYTLSVIDYDMFARWLKACHKIPDATGSIRLSFADACNLVSMGFRDAAPGRWILPPLPSEITHRYPDLAVHAADSGKANDHGVMTAPQTAGRPTLPVSPYRRVPLTMEARLRAALRDPIQRRVVVSLSRRTGSRCTKRQLQQRLRRIPADVLNAALTTLSEAGVVVWDARTLALNAEAHQLIVAARIDVRRPRPARTRRRDNTQTGPDPGRNRETGQTQTGGSDPPQIRPRKTTGPRRYQPRPVPDRRRHPSAWGRSMLSKRGGQERQRQCREAGICATDAANAARAARRAQQERRQTAAGMRNVHVPPVEILTSESALGDTHATDFSSSITASSLSTAWRSLRPVGQRARLAAERNRR
jgi:hypothetical protein